MSVGYVAVYEQGGKLHPDRDGHRDRAGDRAQQPVPGQPELAEHLGQPRIGVSTCIRQRGPAVVAELDGTLRTQGGCLDVVSAGTSSGNPTWHLVSL